MTMDDATQYLDAGVGWLARGQEHRALRMFMLAVRIDAENPEAWFYCGVAHEALQQWPQAQLAYTKALHYNPEFLPARYNLGVLLMRQDAPEVAHPHLCQVVAQVPQFVRGQWAYGLCLERLGRYRAALLCFHQLRRLHPSSYVGEQLQEKIVSLHRRLLLPACGQKREGRLMVRLI
jgi:tetratricopeptide (TPR) repeat protein